MPHFRGVLRPITSYYTGRYDNSTIVCPTVVKIESGLFTQCQDPEPTYLPPLWSVHVHPEGQPYFFLAGPLRVVTEAYLYLPGDLKRIYRWIQQIHDILSQTNIIISQQTELFLKLEDEDCAYYFVDHATRTQFWLETYETDELGIPPVVSTSQLKIALEELYWVHVEHFPVHSEPLSNETLDEIISIFSHGLCDQMTSTVSTFLYTAQDCNNFISMLKECKGKLQDGYSTWIIARLWSMIDHHKYMTHYGQQTARLSRDQSILYDPTPKFRGISTLMTYLTFKDSGKHLARLEDVFVDHFVYADQWKQLIDDSVFEWTTSGCVALVGSGLHYPFLVLNCPIPAILLSSATLFGAGMVSSMFLALKYHAMKRLSPTQAMHYLESVHSAVFKFQILAFIYSLPRALTLWGLIAYGFNWLLVIAQAFGFWTAMGFAGIVSVFLLACYCVTSDVVYTPWSRLCRNSDEPESSIV
ncbi:hypothetical protein C8R43DRAFT_994627 [Mycena crocata]|nr:hypothetical protein C8R43DRAFT_994627 [Mycena crocata]